MRISRPIGLLILVGVWLAGSRSAPASKFTGPTEIVVRARIGGRAAPPEPQKGRVRWQVALKPSTVSVGASLVEVVRVVDPWKMAKPETYLTEKLYFACPEKRVRAGAVVTLRIERRPIYEGKLTIVAAQLIAHLVDD